MSDAMTPEAFHQALEDCIEEADQLGVYAEDARDIGAALYATEIRARLCERLFILDESVAATKRVEATKAKLMSEYQQAINAHAEAAAALPLAIGAVEGEKPS